MRYTAYMYFFLFIVLLFLLFFLSRELTKVLSQLFYHLFHSQTITIYLLSFLFLPGVIIHELSHLFMASILFVPTGMVEFLPEVRENEVKMGSVAIGHTDPLRRFLIGVAPIIGGLGIILLASFYLVFFHQWWANVLLFFIIFETTNTMFSSRKDMEGALGFLAALLFISIILQVFGFPVTYVLMKWVGAVSHAVFFQQVSRYLFFAFGIDVLAIFVTKIAFVRKKH